MNRFSDSLRLARKDYFKLRKHRDLPAWAMWAVTFDYSLRFGVIIVAVMALAGRKGADSSFWFEQAAPILGTALIVGSTLHLVFSAIERWAPQRFIDWSNGRPGVSVSLFFALTSMVCIYAGLNLAHQLFSGFSGIEHAPWQSQRGWLSMVGGTIVFSIVWALVAWDEWHEEQLKRQAQDAQMRLLQAQIEPHYLFNTLANVRSLIDCDTKAASELLDAFTDHLRASLEQMRADTVTLDQELALVGHYLKLMQLRMGDRLRYRIEADPAVRSLPVPPLLLQPLVENAVHHGLERSVEPGTITLRAAVVDGRLCLSVEDDGLGLGAPAQRRGRGVATQNIRERLAARWGQSASLRIEPNHPRGVVATLELPCP